MKEGLFSDKIFCRKLLQFTGFRGGGRRRHAGKCGPEFHGGSFPGNADTVYPEYDPERSGIGCGDSGGTVLGEGR